MIPQPAPERDQQRAGVQLQIKTDLIKVAPGSTESAAFTVKNLGTQVEEFRIAVTGPGWITAAPAALSVYPGQEGAGTLQAAPPRQPSSVAGTTPFRLTATSAVHAGMSSSAAGRVDVAPYYELAAELVPTSSHGRGLTRHDITLDNRGNVPLRIGLRPVDVADGLRLGVPAFADVPPGRVIEVPVSVYGSRRWLGRPEPKPFSVTAEAPKPLGATRLSGTRTVLPVFPRWVPAVAGLAAAAVVATALTATALNRPRPHPSPSPPASSSSGSVSASAPVSASTSASGSDSVSPALLPSFDLISGAASAVWNSWTLGVDQGPATMQTNIDGCQPDAAANTAAVLSLQSAVLEDHTLAPVALETDPPSQAAQGTITGTYTFAAASRDRVFRASVGFCWEVPPAAQMKVEVYVGSSQQAAWSETLSSNNTPLTPTPMTSVDDVLIPAGTTQLELEVSNVTGANFGDVVWVDPLVEDMNASSPNPRATVSP